MTTAAMEKTGMRIKHRRDAGKQLKPRHDLAHQTPALPLTHMPYLPLMSVQLAQPPPTRHPYQPSFLALRLEVACTVEALQSTVGSGSCGGSR